MLGSTSTSPDICVHMHELHVSWSTTCSYRMPTLCVDLHGIALRCQLYLLCMQHTQTYNWPVYFFTNVLHEVGDILEEGKSSIHVV